MANFFKSLQDNNLFTNANPNPLQPPDMSGGFDPIAQFHNLFPYIAREKQKDRDLQLQLAGLNRPRVNQSVAGGFMQSPALKPQPNEPQNVVFDRRGDSADTFANNILNPPERGYKFQELRQKNDIANRGLDIKEGNQDIQASRAGTAQYSAETRRYLASLHNLSDAEKLKMLQEGKVTLQNLKDASDLKEIEARGSESRKTEGVKGDNTVRAIGARGAESRKTQSEKPGTTQSANQERIAGNSEARKLINTQPDLAQYITFDDQGNFMIKPDTPLNELSIIKGALYPGKDIKLGADSKGSSSSSSSGVTRDQAIKALNANKLPVTEENIKKAMDPANHKK